MYHLRKQVNRGNETSVGAEVPVKGFLWICGPVYIQTVRYENPSIYRKFVDYLFSLGVEAYLEFYGVFVVYLVLYIDHCKDRFEPKITIINVIFIYLCFLHYNLNDL